MGGVVSKEKVSYHSPNEKDWELYENSIKSFKSFKIPKIFDEKNKHDYLFIVLADGTENDLKNPNRYTNVAKLKEELKDNKNSNISFHYKEGVGTYEGEGNLVDKTKAKLDAVFSFSHKQRVEEIYEEFSKQANIWKSKNPQANISIIEVGFSRGSGVISLLNQMIHERGIKDTVNRVWKDGKKELTGEYLIKPGQIPQAVLLYDPVTTNMKENLSLSNSTISAFQINANDEYRNLFPLSQIVKGKNQLQIFLSGCHSDIGGGYEKNGLALYSKDIGNKYLNKMIDTKEKLFKDTKLPLKDDPSVVIHHSEEHNIIYRKNKQRRVIIMDKKEYDSKIKRLNIPDYDNSRLSYTSISSDKISKFKEYKLKKSKATHNKQLEKNDISISYDY